jgi:hypothetical protein
MTDRPHTPPDKVTPATAVAATVAAALVVALIYYTSMFVTP